MIESNVNEAVAERSIICLEVNDFIPHVHSSPSLHLLLMSGSSSLVVDG
jgi:hypothetical protein